MQVEHTLKQSETLLNETQRLAKIGGWSWEVETQTTFWTEETYRIHGYTPATNVSGGIDFIDRSLMCYDPEDRPVISSAFQRCIQHGDSYDLEFPFTSVDGQRKWIRTTSTAIYEDNRIVRIIGTLMDITQRKQAEKEIFELNRDLEQRVVERTAELEAVNTELADFSYSVSHDLRAPLRHIDGYLELLQKRMADSLDELSSHYLTSIMNSSRRMGTLIDSLLAFTRMRRTQISWDTLDLNCLVHDVIDQLTQDKNQRRIHWQITDLPTVNGDPIMLRIVLMNLISNAIKFTQTRVVAEIAIGSQTTENETIIFVRDNGVGFDMAYADRLFGVFQRLHRNDEFEGLGIGLANIRRIIRLHGGKTWAEGKLNEGATFYFTLPK